MELTPLSATSPIDGRYRNKTEELADFFSEYALFKYRVKVEIEYFIALCELPLPGLVDFEPDYFEKLRNIYREFSPSDAEAIKNIEQTTNHDVKAVEYFIKECFEELGLTVYKEFIHFGLTSQDINNTAVPMSLKDAHMLVVLPMIEKLISKINLLAFEWKQIAMLARTHGQPASPTRLGKEIYVFIERLDDQLDLLKTIPFSGKFGGATGNMNAHVIAYPEVDWEKFANSLLLDKLELHRQKTTTQIEHYDYLAAYFHNMARINTILTDLSRDIWSYISMDYFKQKIKEGEVGSSAMPHKVNPIDFENAEGNLGIANALLYHMAEKLPVSRLQRDLTDSTVTRNVGVPLAHMLIALKSLLKGFDKLILNEHKLARDLENNWAVVAEAIQTVLRRENYPNPYEALKQLTRTNEAITRESIHRFIDTLDISGQLRAELKMITPENYTGLQLL
ncbi:MAG: adenylosuccinate lyase [Bacteroidetes bacterium]|nr:MAG: adenylosuccinate lyase [Bacteroidota bacterium]RLD74362.1 MAG: adenylosuccinate lyase [Bacteroidota bacterium]RLD87996.1 MAG: adenylosuccinate lyase [Bacteroidota bacterium]